MPGKISMPAQHQRLDGHRQRLNPQQQGVHDSGGVEDVQREALERTDLAPSEPFAAARNKFSVRDLKSLRSSIMM
jgi:hypothetical protein